MRKGALPIFLIDWSDDIELGRFIGSQWHTWVGDPTTYARGGSPPSP